MSSSKKSQSGSSSHKKHSRDQKKRPSKGHQNVKFLPLDLGFLYRIDEIDPVYDKYGMRWIKPEDSDMNNDTYGFWLPPNKMKGIVTARSGELFRWRSSGSVPISRVSETLVEYSVASLFVQSQQDNLLVVNFDCRKQDVGEKSKKHSERRGWGSICFLHCEYGLSAVEFPGSNRKVALAVPAEYSSWMPQVVPRTYSPSIYGAGKMAIPATDEGGLCGRLALLIAMAAVSVDEDGAEDTVAEGFRYGNWIQNKEIEPGIGRYRDRGVVVTIYMDSYSSTTPEQLRAWEKGEFGPIWCAYPNSIPTSLVDASTHMASSAETYNQEEYDDYSDDFDSGERAYDFTRGSTGPRYDEQDSWSRPRTISYAPEQHDGRQDPGHYNYTDTAAAPEDIYDVDSQDGNYLTEQSTRQSSHHDGNEGSSHRSARRSSHGSSRHHHRSG